MLPFCIHGLMIMTAHIFATVFPLKLQTSIRCCTYVVWCDHDHVKALKNLLYVNYIFFYLLIPCPIMHFFCSAVAMCMHYDYVVCSQKAKKISISQSVAFFTSFNGFPHLYRKIYVSSSHGTVRDLLTVWNVCKFNRAIWVEMEDRNRVSVLHTFAHHTSQDNIKHN